MLNTESPELVIKRSGRKRHPEDRELGKEKQGWTTKGDAPGGITRAIQHPCRRKVFGKPGHAKPSQQL